MYNIPLRAYWSIEPGAFDLLRGAISSRLGEIRAAMRIEAREPTELFESRDGVAIIPIKGVMTKETDIFTLLFGGTSTLRVQRAVEAAAANEDVKSILLLVDSPGGSVDGLAELGDAVFAAQQVKPVIAQVTGMAASAAYYVASQAKTVYAQRMDMIGSIGTRLMLYDFHKLFEEEGVEAVPIDTGKFKSAGAMGTEITEEQRADFQRIVDAYYKDFLNAVSRGRGLAMADLKPLADGRMFLAAEAKKSGLIDRIQTVEDTLAKMLPTKSRRGRTAAQAGRDLRLAAASQI